jgi:hypothetical protein
MIILDNNFSFKNESYFYKRGINKTIKKKNTFILDYTRLVEKVLSSKNKHN